MKFKKEKKLDKDFQTKPLIMPNKKLIMEKFGKTIMEKNISLDKADIFQYSFMGVDYKVYVSNNMKNSFIVNISTMKGRILHCDLVDIDRGNTKTAADKVFNRLFQGQQ